MDFAYTAAATLLAYLIGSLSFAVLVSKVFGIADPRTFGSKNPGATNVLRSGNKGAAALTLLLDGFKGWLPVFLVKHYGTAYGLGDASVALVALAAFMGHLFPIFFQFKGGKGVATFFGVVLGLVPWLGLGALLTWLIIAYFFKYSSLAAIVAALFAPVFYLLTNGVIWDSNVWYASVLFLMAGFLIYRHRENIERLLAGKEGRIGGKK